MNPINKKSQEARGIPQPFNRQGGQTPQIKPLVIQPKTALSVQSVKRPIAPPVYKPQTQKNIAQTKTAVTHAKTAVSAQSVKRPVAPPIFRPQAKPESVQAKINGNVRPNAMFKNESFAHRVGSSLNLQPTIQCSKGNRGGKGGLGYTSTSSAYKDEEINQAMSDLNMKGVKGHGKGKPGSGESGQTKNENAKLAAKLRENKQAAKEKLKECTRFHNDDRNIGKECPYCKDLVD